MDVKYIYLSPKEYLKKEFASELLYSLLYDIKNELRNYEKHLYSKFPDEVGWERTIYNIEESFVENLYDMKKVIKKVKKIKGKVPQIAIQITEQEGELDIKEENLKRIYYFIIYFNKLYRKYKRFIRVFKRMKKVHKLYIRILNKINQKDEKEKIYKLFKFVFGKKLIDMGYFYDWFLDKIISDFYYLETLDY